MEGHRNFKALAVATDISPPASPCGMCRQLYASPFSSFHFSSLLHLPLPLFLTRECHVHSIREFCALDMPVVMFDKDGQYVVKTLEELLPMSFGPEDLKGEAGRG